MKGYTVEDVYDPHRYATLGQRHRHRHDPPARLELDRWMRWAWRELGIVTIIRDDLPAQFAGEAILVRCGQLCGIVALRPDLAYPLYTFCHEMGHLMTGAGYALDQVGDERAWHRVPSEAAATEYGLCLLIDEHDLTERLYEGEAAPALAVSYGVPLDALGHRLRLLGVQM